MRRGCGGRHSAARCVFVSGILRRVAVAAAALTLSLGLTACTHDDPDSRYGSVSPLPPHSTSPTPTPTPTSTRGMSDKAQVKALYLDFTAQNMRVQDLPPSRWRPYLSRWAIDPALAQFVDGTKTQLRKHQRFEGAFRPHIFNMEVADKTATVNDCTDQSHTLLRDVKTGKVAVKGPKTRAWIVAHLKKTSVGWRIYSTNVRNQSCVGR